MYNQHIKALERAITSCKKSGNEPNYHFASAGKMINIDKGGQREVDDFHLSRFDPGLAPIFIQKFISI